MKSMRILFAGLAAIALAGCPAGDDGGTTAGPTGLGATADQIAQERELTPDDVAAALKTYTPSGRTDEFIMFASGGHAGQVFVIGIPSMRILRTIAVFTPEPWEGWGTGDKDNQAVLDEGKVQGRSMTWGDTHHPALSETNGDYDGQFLFINDKANSRVAVIDLRDFETKQIVVNPLSTSDHGGTFVTPNTDWVIEGGQYAAPLGVGKYSDIDQYDAAYRGIVTFWKFDRAKGRIDPTRSFAMELPPYGQDLSDAGKGVCDGYVFMNCFNSERATGGVESGNPSFEAGASQRDMDYLHIIDLKKAAEVAKGPKATKIDGMTVIPLQASIDEGLLSFLPEPKSPHGIDITPGGEYAVVSGKLDPHVTVYSTAKILAAIKKGTTQKDPYGVPILSFDECLEKQIEVGLGPLHTQFDDKGYAYTSLFLDSAVARWTLGGPYEKLHPDQPWTLVAKTPVQYNIGHLAVCGGDTMHPDGRFLVAMNKWSIDRFFTTGPLLPQNFQLIDIGQPGATMPVLYDMPVGVGEPHYAQVIRADRLKPWEAYPVVGYNPMTGEKDPNAVEAGKERIEHRPGVTEVWTTVVRSHFTPERVHVKQGDKVIWHLTNIERARDATHGFCIAAYNINLSLEPGEAANVEFVADKPGVYSFYCTEFCSALHIEMTGYLLVEPTAGQSGK
jgi:nitrous-oxide reductase